jgi:hypothetical protein
MTKPPQTTLSYRCSKQVFVDAYQSLSRWRSAIGPIVWAAAGTVS